MLRCWFNILDIIALARGVEEAVAVTNGTIALDVALKTSK